MKPEVQKLLAKIHKTEPVYVGDVMRFAGAQEPCCWNELDADSVRQNIDSHLRFIEEHYSRAGWFEIMKGVFMRDPGYLPPNWIEIATSGYARFHPFVDAAKQGLYALLAFVTQKRCDEEMYKILPRGPGEPCKDYWRRYHQVMLDRVNEVAEKARQSLAEISQQVAQELAKEWANNQGGSINVDIDLEGIVHKVIDAIANTVLITLVLLLFPLPMRLQLRNLLIPIFQQHPIESLKDKSPEELLALVDPNGKLVQATQIALSDGIGLEDAVAQVGGLA